MRFDKLILFSLVALLTVAAALAQGAYTQDPYDGVNRIGTYYQYTNTVAYNYENAYTNQFYDYAAPPRAGGWFGSGTEWLVGLRSPIYSQVPPVHYTNFYQPVCGYPCYFGGGYGYQRSTATAFPPYRERIGGIFSY